MKITGWLTPIGEFIECKPWEHLSLMYNEKVRQRVPKIVSLQERLEEMEKDFREVSEREGSSNAEWHIYEIETDNARHEIWRLLLNEGFIRVGEVDGSIHFEGRPNHLKNKYQICKDFADSYGADAVFEPQR
jgi:hypothetical protein